MEIYNFSKVDIPTSGEVFYNRKIHESGRSLNELVKIPCGMTESFEKWREPLIKKLRHHLAITKKKHHIVTLNLVDYF